MNVPAEIKRRLVVTVSVVLLFGGFGIAQKRASELLTVTNARPVWAAILQLTDKYHWVICYEDPRYSFAGDLEVPHGRKLLAPKLQTISFTYDTSPETGMPSPDEILKQVVAQYKAMNGTNFRVIRLDGRLVVSPVQSRDGSGQVAPHGSVLDTLITVDTGDRDCREALRAIGDALQSSLGEQVTLGGGTHELDRFRCRVSATNEPARSVLLGLFKTVPKGERYAWYINYEPSGNFGWVLNTAWIPQEHAR